VLCAAAKEASNNRTAGKQFLMVSPWLMSRKPSMVLASPECSKISYRET